MCKCKCITSRQLVNNPPLQMLEYSQEIVFHPKDIRLLPTQPSCMPCCGCLLQIHRHEGLLKKAIVNHTNLIIVYSLSGN